MTDISEKLKASIKKHFGVEEDLLGFNVFDDEHRSGIAEITSMDDLRGYVFVFFLPSGWSDYIESGHFVSESLKRELERDYSPAEIKESCDPEQRVVGFSWRR